MIRSVECHDGERWGIHHQRALSVRWAHWILQQDPWHCFQQKALSVLGKHRGTSPLTLPKTQWTPLLPLQKHNFLWKKEKWNSVRKTRILSILLTDEKCFPIEKSLKAEKPLSSCIVHSLQRKDTPLYYLQDIPLCFLYVWLKHICFVGWKNRQWYMYVFWEI